VTPELRALIDLQELDSRIARLEAEAARLPRAMETIKQAVADAVKSVEQMRSRFETTRKALRTKEKDLEVASAKRSKAESRLWEVKTNKEYSAVLLEIEEIKQEKSGVEEEILALMETQERLTADVREAEARLKVREEQAAQEQAVVRKKLDAVESDLAAVRAERQSCARDLAPSVLSSYERIARARGGVAVAAVSVQAPVCGACRVTIRPQAIQELRSAEGDLKICESCGRFLYWTE
jgi:predicted  nucleic acid-binding Zn-ribbon protein